MNFCCSRFNKLSGSVAWGDSLPNWFLTSATTCYFILLLSKMYMLFSLPKVALLKVCFSTIIKFNLIKSYLKWHELFCFFWYNCIFCMFFVYSSRDILTCASGPGHKETRAPLAKPVTQLSGRKSFQCCSGSSQTILCCLFNLLLLQKGTV